MVTSTLISLSQPRNDCITCCCAGWIRSRITTHLPTIGQRTVPCDVPPCLIRKCPIRAVRLSHHRQVGNAAFSPTWHRGPLRRQYLPTGWSGYSPDPLLCIRIVRSASGELHSVSCHELTNSSLDRNPGITSSRTARRIGCRDNLNFKDPRTYPCPYRQCHSAAPTHIHRHCSLGVRGCCRTAIRRARLLSRYCHKGS